MLAITEQKDVTGREALTAFCICMDVTIRLGASERLHIGAIGIAGSTASGIQVFLEEGTWTKRLHPGWAAAGGITAATLARHGFVGPPRRFRALSARCTCHVDPDSLVPEYFSGGVRIRLTDGRELSRQVPVNSGAGDRKMSLDETIKKLPQNTGMVIDDASALSICETVVSLDEMKVAELMARLCYDA